jgi:hypothetical protein
MARVVHVVVGSSAAASFKQAKITLDSKDIFTRHDALSGGPLLSTAMASRFGADLGVLVCCPFQV